MAKEAYSYGKRGLFIRQKRPMKISVPGLRIGESVSAPPCCSAACCVRVGQKLRHLFYLYCYIVTYFIYLLIFFIYSFDLT